MTWRESRPYTLIRPLVPNALRSAVAAVRQFARSKAARRELDFGAFRLLVNNRDSGGIAHESLYWHELSSPLESEIAKRLQPRLFLDIGANYGFSSLIHFANNPECKFVLVEPNPHLISYIRHNLKHAGCNKFTIHNSICSSQQAPHASFAIHPTYSQDSRVSGPPSWQRVEVSSVTIDSLSADVPLDTPILIKIDTQGYEESVLAGGRRLLSTSRSWLMKVEFGPRWLESQGTNPVKFLQSIVASYQVVEMPSRVRMRGDTIDTLFSHPLLTSDCEAFEHFVRHRASSEGGYCDLLVLPKDSRLLNRGA
jgi:FkbM family methyltransferase